MSKTPVNFSFQEVLTSAEHNQQTVDYLTSGETFVNWYSRVDANDNGNPISVGWHPYRSTKSVWDRLYVFGEFCATITFPQYSLNGGGAWTTIAGGVPPVPVENNCGALTQFNVTVPLDTIVGFQWIGLRWSQVTVPVGFGYLHMFAFFYNSTYDPF